jgi:hypothetical protein
MFRQDFFESLNHRRSSDNLVAEQFRSLRPLIPTMYIAVFINIMFLSSVSAPEAGSAAFILPAILRNYGDRCNYPLLMFAPHQQTLIKGLWHLSP